MTLADLAGDGALSAQELHVMLGELGVGARLEDAQAMIDAADEKPDPITALAISAFKKFDANGDGALDVEEIKGVLEELGYPQGEGGRCARLATCCCKHRGTGAETEDSALTVEQAFQDCDADGNGKIEQQEFV